ncbi:MAG: flagellar hook-length control protein FliK [Planctomycetaceae bacterium]
MTSGTSGQIVQKSTTAPAPGAFADLMASYAIPVPPENSDLVHASVDTVSVDTTSVDAEPVVTASVDAERVDTESFSHRSLGQIMVSSTNLDMSVLGKQQTPNVTTDTSLLHRDFAMEVASRQSAVAQSYLPVRTEDDIAEIGQLLNVPSQDVHTVTLFVIPPSTGTTDSPGVSTADAESLSAASTNLFTRSDQIADLSPSADGRLPTQSVADVVVPDTSATLVTQTQSTDRHTAEFPAAATGSVVVDDSVDGNTIERDQNQVDGPLFASTEFSGQVETFREDAGVVRSGSEVPTPGWTNAPSNVQPIQSFIAAPLEVNPQNTLAAPAATEAALTEPTAAGEVTAAPSNSAVSSAPDESTENPNSASPAIDAVSGDRSPTVADVPADVPVIANSGAANRLVAQQQLQHQQQSDTPVAVSAAIIPQTEVSDAIAGVIGPDSLVPSPATDRIFFGDPDVLPFRQMNSAAEVPVEIPGRIELDTIPETTFADDIVSFTNRETATLEAVVGESSAPSIASQANASAANSSVAPATQATEFGPMPNVVEQLAAEVTRRVETLSDGGQQRFIIRLDPPELGRMVISMKRTVGGIEMHVDAADPETLNLIQAGLDRLSHEAPDTESIFRQLNIDVTTGSGSGRSDQDRRPSYPASRIINGRDVAGDGEVTEQGLPDRISFVA